MTRAADRTGLPVALIAELIGTESGFRNVKNPHSSASGCGQQIVGNDVMRRFKLDRMKCDQSIMGAAIELREKWDRTGSLERALRAYGTTAGLRPAARTRIEARMTAAARSDGHQLAGQAVGRQAEHPLQPVALRQGVVIAGDLDRLGAGRHQPR